jgi:hypothetical protein
MDTMIRRHEVHDVDGTDTMSDIKKKIFSQPVDPNILARSGDLSGIFPPTIGCLLEDLEEILAGDAPLEFGSIYIEKLERILRDFKTAFTLERFYPMYGLVKYYLDIIEHPIVELKEYFNNPEGYAMTPKRAAVFVYFIKEHVEILTQVAREIDQISP